MGVFLAVMLQDHLRDLGSDDYAVRERATAALLAMEFEKALPILREGLASRDPEVHARARWVLDAVWPDYEMRRGAQVVPDPDEAPPPGITDGIVPWFVIPARFFDPDAGVPPGR